MADTRRPLCPTHDNPPAIVDENVGSSTPPKLFDIFLDRTSPVTNPRQPRPAKQRRTRSTGCDGGKVTTKAHEDYAACDTVRQSNRLSTYFAPTTPLRVVSGSCGRPGRSESATHPTWAPHDWRRPRKRLGLNRVVGGASDPFLETLVTRLCSDPRLPPSTVFLPSLSSPTGQDRDRDPALTVAFNRKAKLSTKSDASSYGDRRLLAIGGEEGGIKIVDIDSPEESDVTWWTAHQNGVFDLSWCDDDKHILSASADQTLRLHDVGSGDPRVLATLYGHTSTIKTTAFLHDYSSNVIVSGGRDGNINVFDLRCRGYTDTQQPVDRPSLRRSSRTRSTAEVDLTTDSSVHPVLTLRQPHNSAAGRKGAESRSVTRTITSLVALRSQPGILASGGSYDGVVKLWDVRCPEPTSSARTKSTLYGVLPDPTIAGGKPSRRPRSINALCEEPSTGDLFALCGDSKIHVLRPSAAKAADAERSEAILPRRFVHPQLAARSFYIRMAMSPDGRHLACGSSSGGVMMWDVHGQPQSDGDVEATRLQIPHSSAESPEVIAVDWGKDMIAASSDDCTTRIWHSDLAISSQIAGAPSAEWSGVVRVH